MDITFPDLPDEPREARSPGSGRSTPAPEVPQPKPINYGVPLVRSRWVGRVMDWDQKYRWGRPLPCPQPVMLHCWASTAEEAHFLLHKQAKQSGYALGGVQDIRQEAKK